MSNPTFIRMDKCSFLCMTSALLLCLCGCVRDQFIHLKDSPPVVELSAPSSSDSTTANERVKTTRLPASSIAIIEFDDKGRLWPCPDDPTCQITRAQNYIKEARLSRGTKSVAVISFVHGWHHNASDRSYNFRYFQRMIECLNWGDQPQRETGRRYPEKQPINCSGMSADPSTLYIGVYIGWRGESVSPKLGFVTALSLLNRQKGAVSVAENKTAGGLEDTIIRLSEAAKNGADPKNSARFILIGHSFGGLIVSRISADLLERRLDSSETLTAKPCDQNSQGSGSFADLIIYLNPADSSVRTAGLIARMKDHESGTPILPCQGPELNLALKRPLVLSLHTSSDSATDGLGAWVLKHSGYDKKYPRADEVELNRRPDQVSSFEHVPGFEELRGDTINYAHYLRNVCYLDQPNGQDEICSGVNDKIYWLKKEAYEEVMGEGKEPTIKNPDYWKDPFYHGAYELLTGICHEEYEAPEGNRNKRRQDKKRPVDDADLFLPDFDSPLCSTGDLRERRKGLRVKLELKLHDYLAFPEEKHSASGGLLLDVYARVYTGCYRSKEKQKLKEGNKPPKDCLATPEWTNPALTVRQRPWNDTPVWLLNTSYEIVQKHNGFWNTDAISLMRDVIAQFEVIPFDPLYSNLLNQPKLEHHPLTVPPAASKPNKYPKQKRQQQQQQQQRNK